MLLIWTAFYPYCLKNFGHLVDKQCCGFGPSCNTDSNIYCRFIIYSARENPSLKANVFNAVLFVDGLRVLKAICRPSFVSNESNV